jgi:hypothetical protein
VKDRDPVTADEKIEPRVFFKTTFVFDVSQTEPLPGADPVPLEPPRQPLTGDSHAQLLAPLQACAGSLGYTVSFKPLPGSTDGWCDAASKRIVVDADAPANRRSRARDVIAQGAPRAERRTRVLLLGGYGWPTAVKRGCVVGSAGAQPRAAQGGRVRGRL